MIKPIICLFVTRWLHISEILKQDSQALQKYKHHDFSKKIIFTTKKQNIFFFTLKLKHSFEKLKKHNYKVRKVLRQFDFYQQYIRNIAYAKR